VVTIAPPPLTGGITTPNSSAREGLARINREEADLLLMRLRGRDPGAVDDLYALIGRRAFGLAFRVLGDGAAKEAGGDWVRIEATLGQVGRTASLGGFEPLTSDRDYQLWAVRDETALQRGDQIANTEEAHGGSNAPTMDPLLSTKI
jgi:hypothetical protein